MRSSACAVVFLMVLAGCADPAPAEEEPDDFGDVDVRVDERSGAILGVVVNDAVVPVEGATVTLQRQSGAVERTTDAQGRFVFDGLEPGTYFLTASKQYHESVQFSAEVEPGVAQPPAVKVQLPRLFKSDPYMQTIVVEGFYTCSQNGASVFYSSSPCDSTPFTPPTGAFPQNRDFHADVGAGWQTMVFEMTWEPSLVGTAPWMGIVVSTYKPERPGNHWFMNFEGPQPLLGRNDCCDPHPTGQQGSGDHAQVPPEGIQDMSYFMSVRSDSLAPAVAIDQEFQCYLSLFYYAAAPEDWSLLAGDGNPF